MKPEDVLFYADNGDETMKVEVFGVKLQISDLLDLDPKGGSKTSHKIKGSVTSPTLFALMACRTSRKTTLAT